MRVYTCTHEWSAMLTCIYDAWSSKLGHKNIRLQIEPVIQYSLFDEYIHVDADTYKAEQVIDAVNYKISPYVYHELAYCSMSSADDMLDIIYRVMILGFHYGPSAINRTQYREVMRFQEIRKNVGNEVCHFKEFLRFHQIGDSLIAHIEPKCYVLPALGINFSDRMPSVNWMIIDDTHKEAAVHCHDEPYYIRKLTDDELQRLLITDSYNDELTDLWKTFFNATAIKERYNPEYQRNSIPLWTRKHAVEFQ